MKSRIASEDLIGRAESIASEELAPRAAEIDKEGRWPEKSIRALQKAGLGGLVISSEFGGHNQGLVEVAKVCEILGQHCASTALCFGMHLVGSAVLAAKATPKQQEKYLIPIAKGEHLTTLSLSEPGTGSNFYIPQAKLTERENDGYILDGTKSFVTNGGYADSYVASAVIPDPDTPVGKFSCVVIPNDAEGIEWQESWEGMGMKGNASRTLAIDNLHIPKEDLLGKEGDQLWYIFEVIVPYFLMAMSGTYLGIAQAALDEAVDHLKQRTHSHSGKSLAQQPVIQHRLGELWAKTERTRQLIYSAATKGDAGDPSDPNALLPLLNAKAEVSESVVDVVNEVMTLMGGKAYAESGKLERLLRDARAAHVMAPPTDLLRTWTGRELLDIPLLGE